MELENKLIEALARAMAAEKIADKALEIAQDALIKVEAMKQSTHKVELINPMSQEQQELLEEVKEVMAPADGRPDSEEVPVRQKLSPFTMFGGTMGVKPLPVIPTPDYEALLDNEEENITQEALWDLAVNDEQGV